MSTSVSAVPQTIKVGFDGSVNLGPVLLDLSNLLQF